MFFMYESEHITEAYTYFLEWMPASWNVLYDIGLFDVSPEPRKIICFSFRITPQFFGAFKYEYQICYKFTFFNECGKISLTIVKYNGKGNISLIVVDTNYYKA